MLEQLKVHHIGYLVRNIEKAKKVFLGFEYEVVSECVHDSFRGIDIIFLEKDGYMIELVSPTDDTSDVASLKKKIGNSPYHICYEVNDLPKMIDMLQKERFVLVHEPHNAVAISNRRVAFLMHGQIGLIELVEKVD